MIARRHVLAHRVRRQQHMVHELLLALFADFRLLRDAGQVIALVQRGGQVALAVRLEHQQVECLVTRLALLNAGIGLRVAVFVKLGGAGDSREHIPVGDAHVEGIVVPAVEPRVPGVDGRLGRTLFAVVPGVDPVQARVCLFVLAGDVGQVEQIGLPADHGHPGPRPLVGAAQLDLRRRGHEARIARWLLGGRLLLLGSGVGKGILLQRRRRVAQRLRIKQLAAVLP